MLELILLYLKCTRSADKPAFMVENEAEEAISKTIRLVNHILS